MATADCFKDYEAKAKDCKTIKELFACWKGAQGSELNWEETAAKKGTLMPDHDDFKKNFCPDGFLADKKPERTPILFICKESHVMDNGNGGKKDIQPFWMKEVFNEKKKNKFYKQNEKEELTSMQKQAQTKYYNCLTLTAEKFEVDLSDCAYMNINKRGGYSSTDPEQLENYAKKYSVFIKKEIELLDPENIVVCGKLSDKILNIIEEQANRKPYQCKHPSRYSKKEIGSMQL